MISSVGTRILGRELDFNLKEKKMYYSDGLILGNLLVSNPSLDLTYLNVEVKQLSH